MPFKIRTTGFINVSSQFKFWCAAMQQQAHQLAASINVLRHIWNVLCRISLKNFLAAQMNDTLVEKRQPETPPVAMICYTEFMVNGVITDVLQNGKSKYMKEKLPTATLLTQIPHGLTWDRTRSSA